MENLTELELIRQLRLLKQDMKDLRGERILLALEGGRPTLVTLASMRTSSAYFVQTELLCCENGTAGDIIISDKLRNGFTITCTGNAQKVKLALWVQGEMA